MIAILIATSFMMRPFDIHFRSPEEIQKEQNEEKRRNGEEVPDIDPPEKDENGYSFVGKWNGGSYNDSGSRSYCMDRDHNDHPGRD